MKVITEQTDEAVFNEIKSRMAGFTERLSFDDVLLLPKRSEVMPHQVDTSTELMPGIKLSIPFVSAPMDTVTEARMAIALAREGGVGVIHRNLSIDEQADMVDRVKRSEHGIIHNPIQLEPDKTIQDALNIMERYHISGVPVTEKDGELVGILTNRDIRFETDFSRPIRERMTPKEKLWTASVGTTLEQAERILQEHRIEKLPLVDEEGRLTGLITIKDILKLKQYPNSTKDAKGRLVVGAAIGALREPYERAKALYEAGVDFVVIDAAHGHTKGVMDCLKLLKDKLPDLKVVAGNVVDREGVRELASLGADCLRVGIGAGSICTTRVVAGIGVPQFSAVVECAEAAKEVGITTIADGGIRSSGDIAKSLAAGADAVMMGNMFAGCDESPGEIEMYRNRAYKVYRGMGSIGAMRQGSSDRYFAIKEPRILVPEGVEGRVPYRGPLSETITQMIGGLRSGMGYVGAGSLKELQSKAEFIKITNAGLRESHPHDVWITKEPPNYSSPPFGSESD